MSESVCPYKNAPHRNGVKSGLDLAYWSDWCCQPGGLQRPLGRGGDVNLAIIAAAKAAVTNRSGLPSGAVRTVPAEFAVADHLGLCQIRQRRFASVSSRRHAVPDGVASPPFAIGLPVPLTWLIRGMDDCLPEATPPTAGLVAVGDGSASHRYRSALP